MKDLGNQSDPASPRDSASNQSSKKDKQIVLGKIASPFGVRGWTKVVSYTDPYEGLLEYQQWNLSQGNQQKTYSVVEGKRHGKFLIAKFDGIDDRDLVARLTNALVVLDRVELPEAESDSYYWADLIGLAVITTQGVRLGEVERMMETGANDVVVVSGERERLIPWIRDSVIKSVSLTESIITVDWDADF